MTDLTPIEHRMRKALEKAGIYAEPQYSLLTANGKEFKMDFAIVHRKIDIECDGIKFHTKLHQIERDRRRTKTLNAKGWKVLRFSSADIYHRIDFCISEIKKTIEKRYYEITKLE